jgi:hypothetical protein
VAQGNSLVPGRNLIRPGCLITVATGMIAKKYGPGIGGLFLAFPAILPASATLIEKHEKQKKERLRMHGSTRARQAVAIDAAGAAIGSIGLLVFALVMARWLPKPQTWDRNGRVDPQLDDCLLAHLADKKTNAG